MFIFDEHRVIFEHNDFVVWLDAHFSLSTGTAALALRIKEIMTI